MLIVGHLRLMMHKFRLKKEVPTLLTRRRGGGSHYHHHHHLHLINLGWRIPHLADEEEGRWQPVTPPALCNQSKVSIAGQGARPECTIFGRWWKKENSKLRVFQKYFGCIPCQIPLWRPRSVLVGFLPAWGIKFQKAFSMLTVFSATYITKLYNFADFAEFNESKNVAQNRFWTWESSTIIFPPFPLAF